MRAYFRQLHRDWSRGLAVPFGEDDGAVEHVEPPCVAGLDDLADGTGTIDEFV